MKTLFQTIVSTSVLSLSAACAGTGVQAQDEPVPQDDPADAQARSEIVPPEIVSDETVMEGDAAAHDEMEPLPTEADLEGAFIGTDGSENGTVAIAETPTGLLLRIDVMDIEHGFHGVHFHETGLCESEEGFTTAGGHANPEGAEHGFVTEGGSHLGDMPNAYAHQEGHLRTDLFKEGATLADLQDEDGFAVMVHSGADDYESQPSGDAGSRVACAAFPTE